MGTTQATTMTSTFTHTCGHTCDWLIRTDFTRRDRADISGRKCPRCQPQAWYSNETLTIRPLLDTIVIPAPKPVQAAGPVAPELATWRQLDYLARLGVVVPAGRQLTIREASAAIDEAKRSGSVGWLNLSYSDGSN